MHTGPSDINCSHNRSHPLQTLSLLHCLLCTLKKMGSVLSNPEASRDQKPMAMPMTVIEDPDSSFDCAVCLEVLNRPTRTRCGHVFCQVCIKTSLNSNSYACPYCRAHLTSEGTPAVDIDKKMKSIYQNCEECQEKICLSEMRAHLNNCQLYISKYGTTINVEKPLSRDIKYPCPFCSYEVDEEGLVIHCFEYHSTEHRLVICPVCHMQPRGDLTYRASFLNHLHIRHTGYSEEYIAMFFS
ncbi:E3 ubiquitin-protein ligase RNF125 isoform X2 [Hyperolius riggenbachi]|uniref:E3 ubiquitin-protein ligase RNF125 isoform X2 n=1 Tax=Hyperolius riggenbachi TaxID=752182 RepID=UPI0035A383EE